MWQSDNKTRKEKRQENKKGPAYATRATCRFFDCLIDACAQRFVMMKVESGAPALARGAQSRLGVHAALGACSMRLEQSGRASAIPVVLSSPRDQQRACQYNFVHAILGGAACTTSTRCHTSTQLNRGARAQRNLTHVQVRQTLWLKET